MHTPGCLVAAPRLPNTQAAHFSLQIGYLECGEKYSAKERKKDRLNKEIIKRWKGGAVDWRLKLVSSGAGHWITGTGG